MFLDLAGIYEMHVNLACVGYMPKVRIYIWPLIHCPTLTPFIAYMSNILKIL